MIRVIHFDYNKFDSGAIREILEFEFRKYQEIRYYDFMKDHSEGLFGLDELEKRLSEYDVLLMHPGMQNQRIALGYSKQFPNLRVALVIPGAFSHYHREEIEDIPVFGYLNVEDIIKFVLQKK